MRTARALSYAICTAFLGTALLSSSQGVESTPQPRAPVAKIGAQPVPAPIMIGTPIFYDGPLAGRYPNSAWVNQINDALAQLGFQSVESCVQRTQTASYAYLVGCDGRFHLISDMYSAAASLAAPSIQREKPREVASRKPGERVPDIVDTTVPLRVRTYGAIQEAAAAAARHDVPIYGRQQDPDPFIDAALGSAVPRTASRSAVPQLLQPQTAVPDPLPAVASARGGALRPPQAIPPIPPSKPKVMTVETPEKVDKPNLADFGAGATTASSAPVPENKQTVTDKPAPKQAARSARADKKAHAAKSKMASTSPQ